MTDFLIANIFAGFVFFSILMFILFDGMTIGVGLIFPFITKKEREIAMATLHPFWDVNETWLIMAAIFLMTGFNHAYAMFISECYIPIVILLGAITFRIGALEFTHKYDKHSSFWNMTFFGSCLLISIILGLFVGNMAIGFNASKGFFAKIIALISFIPLVSAVLSVIAFSVMGSMWLVLKTEGVVQNDAQKIAKKLLKTLFLVGLFALGSIIFKLKPYNFTSLNAIAFFISATSFFSCIIGAFISLNNKKELLGLLFSYGITASGSFILLSITYPYLVPYKYTIYDSLRFTVKAVNYQNILIALILGLAVVLLYFFRNYRAFKGKITKVFYY